MGENRRTGLSEEELETIAEKLAVKIAPSGQCKLTEDQQRAVINLISAKDNVIKVTIWLVGAAALWLLYDVYLAIKGHITWVWGK